MSEHKWKGGGPPGIGWWNASVVYNKRSWRWWNGAKWSSSLIVYDENSVNYPDEKINRMANAEATCDSTAIRWTDYYPKNARVPRNQ